MGATDAGLETLEENYKAGKISKNSYEQRMTSYYRALGREKNMLVKLSDYISRSAVQN